MLGMERVNSQDVPLMLIGAAVFLLVFAVRYRHRSEDRLSRSEIYAPGVVGLLLLAGALGTLIT